MVPLPVKPNFSGSFSLVFITWWFFLQYFYYFDNDFRVDLLPDLLIVFLIVSLNLITHHFFKLKSLVRNGCLYWERTSDGWGQRSLIEDKHSSGGGVGSLTLIIANIGSGVCIQ